MNYILFDDANRDHLLPLTFLRPVADIRCGILTMRERWELFLKRKSTVFTADYLKGKFSCTIAEDNIFINGSVFANAVLHEYIHQLKSGQAYISTNNNIPLAFRISNSDYNTLNLSKYSYITFESIQQLECKMFPEEFKNISRPWDVFRMNESAIQQDFNILTSGRQSAQLSSSNHCNNFGNIFAEESAVIECASINAASGPVYIGHNAEIMENCAIRGPFSLNDHSVLKMGAKIYGGTTIGPNCKVGGEVSNSVFFGNSNKAHDGFLGNSVIAEWCNLGADTNNSNLKNTYDIVKLWSYPEKHFISTGLQFCGLIMGDHSKSAINTMFNTGTVIGVSSNIFGEGFPRNYIPSFSWGGASGFKRYDFQKSIEVARAVMLRRNVILSEIDIEIFTSLFSMTE